MLGGRGSADGSSAQAATSDRRQAFIEVFVQETVADNRVQCRLAG